MEMPPLSDDLIYWRPHGEDYILDDNLPIFGPSSNNGDIHRSKANLGALEQIPLELLQIIISQLDLWTLTNFQYVNLRAMGVVDSVHQYKMIATHAPNVLRSILAIEAGQWITCETAYEILCGAECEQCGNFGGYLYILTCKHVCFLCSSEDKRYLPLYRREAMRNFGVNDQIINKLPCMRSIPGTYSLYQKKIHKRFSLVDYESAHTAGIVLHGSSSAIDQHVSDRDAQKLQVYYQRFSRTRSRRPCTGDAFDGRSGNPMRFVAIVCAPLLNRISKDLEWGFHCVGCQGLCSRPLHYRRKFTVESFSEHLKESGNTQNRKHHPS